MKKHISIIIGGTKGIGKIITKTLSKRGDYIITASRKNSSQKNHLSIDLSDGKKKIKDTIDSFFRSNNKKIKNLIFCQRYRGNDSYIDFEVSLHASSHIIEILKKRMVKNSSIVLISSIATMTVVHDQALSYHLTRSAINQMAKYYAIHLGNKGIRCNAILATKIIKPENKKFYLKPKNKVTKMIKTITPLNKMGDAQDVANVVDFLTSDKSSFLTGLIIPVDGGASLSSQESIAEKIK